MTQFLCSKYKHKKHVQSRYKANHSKTLKATNPVYFLRSIPKQIHLQKKCETEKKKRTKQCVKNHLLISQKKKKNGKYNAANETELRTMKWENWDKGR